MRSEFDFIHRIKKKYGLESVGDDCAVLPKNDKYDLVVTADLLVEDIDFRLGWTSPELLGQKALAVSLSDIAAMGAEPDWAMLSVGIPERLWRDRWLDSFYDGWFIMANHYRVELAGGDISRSPDRLVIDSIVGGNVEKGSAILRSGARAGDKIFVTGVLGGAAGGLMLLESGTTYKTAGKKQSELIARQLRPVPQIGAAKLIMRDQIASAMIDISDGLSSDLHHLCAESGVGARLDASAIPIDPNLASLPLDDNARLSMALNGGEDFELLLTVPPEKFSAAETAGFTCIGEVAANADIVEITANGVTTILPAKGFRHF